MSAEVLREAAALMRERAEAAESMLASPWNVGPWGARGGGAADGYSIGYATNNPLAGLVATCADYVPLNAADHIASWHPAAALEVAELLEDIAAWEDEGLGTTRGIERTNYPDAWADIRIFALAVARAYLGDPS